MNKFEEFLTGGNPRSLGQSHRVVSLIDSQQTFDDLFKYLFHQDRTVVMRTADVIEKVTLEKPGYLKSHARELLDLAWKTSYIELKWHLAQLLTRLSLSEEDFVLVWDLLTSWALNKKESRIVRVNALQGLFDLLQQQPELAQDFQITMAEMEKQPFPSLTARVKRFKPKTTARKSI